MKKKISLIIVSLIILISCSKDEDKGFDATYMKGSGPKKDVTIIFLGGTEGGIPTFDYSMYTKQGYSVLALAYFGTENSAIDLNMIPIEYFEKPIKWLKGKKRDNKIVVFGASKGGELALLLASEYSDINGVIAASPSSVVFQGFTGDKSASWSKNGESYAFVPYVPFDSSKLTDTNYLELYNSALKQDKKVKEASIPVENIKGDILLISGKEDTMWPSSDMCDDMISRLTDNNFNYNYEHVAFEDAGHTLSEFYLMGGTEEGNRNARLNTDELVFEFLEGISN